MARAPRDYAAEYERRVDLGRERGYSRAVARGHAREGELPAAVYKAKAVEVVPLSGGRSQVKIVGKNGKVTYAVVKDTELKGTPADHPPESPSVGVQPAPPEEEPVNFTFPYIYEGEREIE